MRKIAILGFISVFFVSCGTIRYPKKVETKPTTNKELKSNTGGKKKTTKLVDNILSEAETYLGAPYKLGGMSHSGIDCSGLLYKVFEKNNLSIPRRSIEQSQEGRSIAVREIKEGDLLFFATGKDRSVTHSGIVHSVENDGEIKFIHASSSRGVMISSLNNVYWNKAFLFAKRVIF